MQKCELIFWNSKYPGDSGSRQKAGLLFGYYDGCDGGFPHSLAKDYKSTNANIPLQKHKLPTYIFDHLKRTKMV